MLDVKQMRYIGKDNFNYGKRLDIDFADIFESIDCFDGVIGFDEKGEVTCGKPRFSLLRAKTHCTMPLLSRDYYLIGFTDILGSNAKYYKFVYDGCTGEYISKKSEISEYPYFEKECIVLEKKL